MATRAVTLDDRIDRPETQISKYGPMSRNPRLKQLVPMMEYLESAWDGEFLYDIYYGTDDAFRSLHATEFFSQALLITACSDDARYTLADLAVHDDVAPLDVARLTASFTDKYRLVRKRSLGPQVGTVFLPGGNLLEDELVDFALVDTLVDNGYWVKPHPITPQRWMARFHARYPGRVHRENVSGKDLMQLSEAVATSTASELGLMAMLLGKEVRLVDADHPGTQRNIYRQLYRVALNSPTPQETLAKVMASPYSGLWWQGEPSRKADRIIDIIREYFHGHHGVHRSAG
jgi:hypothetical protein